MSNIINFTRRSKQEVVVVIWQDDHGHPFVTVFDHGHERKTVRFMTYEHAVKAAALVAHTERAPVEDRIAAPRTA